MFPFVVQFWRGSSAAPVGTLALNILLSVLTAHLKRPGNGMPEELDALSYSISKAHLASFGLSAS